MKFGMVNKSTTVNRFVLHTSHRNITHLAIIRRKTNIKLGILKRGGGTGKEPKFSIKCLKTPFCVLTLQCVNNLNFFSKSAPPLKISIDSGFFGARSP